MSNLGTCAMYCCGAVPGPGACALVWSKSWLGDETKNWDQSG